MSAVTFSVIIASIWSTSESRSGAREAAPALLTSMVMLGSSRSTASTLASAALSPRSAGITLTDRPVSDVRRAAKDFSRSPLRATRIRS